MRDLQRVEDNSFWTDCSACAFFLALDKEYRGLILIYGRAANMLLLCVHDIYDRWLRFAINNFCSVHFENLSDQEIANGTGDIFAATHGERVQKILYPSLNLIACLTNSIIMCCIWARKFINLLAGFWCCVCAGLLYLPLLLCSVTVRHSDIASERNSGGTGHPVKGARHYSGIISSCQASVRALLAIRFPVYEG